MSGTISGLQGSGLVLANAYSGATLAVEAGATAFTFDPAADGFYDIVVLSSPVSPSQACTVAGGTGFYGGSAAPAVSVQCTSDIGLVEGTIIGLKGTGLALVQSNGEVVEPAAGDTGFTFAAGLSEGMRYSVGIGHQPQDPAQTCTIRQGKGAMPDTNGVHDITVDCVDNETSPLWGTYGFQTPSGAQGYMTFFADGTYSYVVRMDDPDCGANDGNGVEYGVYHWDNSDPDDPTGEAGSGPFSIVTAVIDTNGDCGLSKSVEGSQELLSGVLDRTSNPPDSVLTLNTGSEVLTLTRVEQDQQRLLGSFKPGTARVTDGQAARLDRVSGAFTVFSSDDAYVSVETQDAPGDGGLAGGEWGCATWGPYELEMTCYPGDPRYLDLNGTGGLSRRLSYGSTNLVYAGGWLFMGGMVMGGYLESYWSRIDGVER